MYFNASQPVCVCLRRVLGRKSQQGEKKKAARCDKTFEDSLSDLRKGNQGCDRFRA